MSETLIYRVMLSLVAFYSSAILSQLARFLLPRLPDKFAIALMVIAGLAGAITKWQASPDRVGGCFVSRARSRFVLRHLSGCCSRFNDWRNRVKQLPHPLKNRPRLPQLSSRVELIILGSTAVLAVFSATLMPYRSQFLAVRILEFTGYSVGLVSTIGCARKIETPQKREREHQQRLNDLEYREALLREREADLERRKLEVLTQMQQRQQQFEAINTERSERQQQFYEQAIAQLRQQIAIANAPRWDISGKTQSQNCNAILQHLWREHDIVVDCHEQSQYDPASQTETYILRARSPKDVKKIVSEDFQSEYEAVLHGEGAIKASQHGGLIVIKFAVGQDSRQAQVKKREALQSQMFRIEQTVGLSLGYFLAGNSGSGKTAIRRSLPLRDRVLSCSCLSDEKAHSTRTEDITQPIGC